MVELAMRGRKISKPKEEPKPRKNPLPYAALAAFAALIALIPFLGVMQAPGPTLIATGQSNVSTGPFVSGSQFCDEFSGNTDLLDIFPVETNSVVDSMELDNNVRQLTICVHGDDGSNGFSRVLVPKDILGERLKVTLDNQPANANIQDFGRFYLVSLDYHHSERVIRIFGEDVAPTPTVPRAGNQTSGTGEQQQQQQLVVVVPAGGSGGDGTGTQGPSGLSCWDLNGNGVADPAEDINKDGRVGVLDCRAPPTPTGLCPPKNLTPDSILAAGIPVVFSSEEKPTATDADATGIRIQTKTRAVINFLSDVGETVKVKFKLDNLSTSDSLVRVRISAPDVLLIDLIKGGGIDTLRPISANEYVIQLKGSTTKAELETQVTPLVHGLHPFILEILPLVEQVECI